MPENANRDTTEQKISQKITKGAKTKTLNRKAAKLAKFSPSLSAGPFVLVLEGLIWSGAKYRPGKDAAKSDM
jgi:hypothetical protein